MPRPRKLTKKLQAKIVAAIEAGNYPETAAVINGITGTTFYNYMKKGRESKTKRGVYFEFFEAVKKAERYAEAYFLQHIREAAEGNEDSKPSWTAAAWYLERKYPEKWGRNERINIKGEMQGEIKVKQTVKVVGRLFKIAESANEESDQQREEQDK